MFWRLVDDFLEGFGIEKPKAVDLHPEYRRKVVDLIIFVLANTIVILSFSIFWIIHMNSDIFSSVPTLSDVIAQIPGAKTFFIIWFVVVSVGKLCVMAIIAVERTHGTEREQFKYRALGVPIIFLKAGSVVALACVIGYNVTDEDPTPHYISAGLFFGASVVSSTLEFYRRIIIGSDVVEMTINVISILGMLIAGGFFAGFRTAIPEFITVFFILFDSYLHLYDLRIVINDHDAYYLRRCKTKEV